MSTEKPPPVKPVFGQPLNKCALCGYPFANKSRFKIDEQGRAVCKAAYACSLRVQFLVNAGGKRPAVYEGNISFDDGGKQS